MTHSKLFVDFGEDTVMENYGRTLQQDQLEEQDGGPNDSDFHYEQQHANDY